MWESADVEHLIDYEFSFGLGQMTLGIFYFVELLDDPIWLTVFFIFANTLCLLGYAIFKGMPPFVFYIALFLLGFANR
ncbi:MAG: hypothetical protein IH840_17830 [Candidatus Heimdallarchaeota archaeon]|nr:hypothetical protein [Candidatus Heimdallarchaeota archaeon]